MDKRELELIQELMDKLSDEMEYDEEDLSSRLGRKKPEVEVIKMEGKLPLDEDSLLEEMPEEEEEEPSMDLFDEDESEEPESDLKKRLMRLRE